MKFIKYKHWLNERKGKNLKYACVMLGAEIPKWKEFHLLINKEDIYDDENHEYGLEKEPHITLLYGIHEDEVDMIDISGQFEKIHPVTVTIEKTGIFDTDENYDVLKYDVPVTKELLKYRKYFKQFPNTESFSEYHLHMTICYIKSGIGKKYIDKIKPFEVTFTTGIYSSPSHNKQKFKLRNES